MLRAHHIAPPKARRSGYKLSALIALCASVGCAEESDLAEVMRVGVANEALPQGQPSTSKADAWRSIVGELDEGEVTVSRLSLGELQGESIDYLEDFDGLFTAGEALLDGSIRADSKRGLMGTLTSQQLSRSGESGVLREDVYQAQGSLEPLKWVSATGKVSALLPFKVKSGAEVRFIRLFKGETEARSAPPLTPHQLPFDLARALALPEGVVVEIPIEAQVSLNVNGQLLSKAWGRSNQLAKFLSASSAGFVSSSLQGALLIEGELALHITRLPNAQLRVRVTQHTRSTERGTAGAQAGGSFQAKLLPSATIERVKSMKDRLLRWGRRPNELVRGAQERLTTLSQGLPALLRGLRDLEGADRLPWWLEGALNSAEVIEDPALNLLQRGGEGLAGAEDWLREEVGARLGAIDARLNPAFTWLKQHSERAFNLSASIQLSAEDARQVGVMGDYLLDLSSPRGAAAFELLLSGRARWEGALETLSAQRPMIDLTVVDLLAEANEEGVRRLARAELNGRRVGAQINISAPLTQWRFEQGRELKQLKVERGAVSERWEAEIWRVDRGLEVGPVREREQLSVGIALPLDSNIGAGWRAGALWLSWSKRWPSYEQQPVTRTLGEALNLTGRLGAHLGLMSHFNAEAPGALSSELTFTLNGALLETLFEEVNPSTLWRVVAQTASSFDNRFGLPYLNAFSRPSLPLEEAQACDEIAYHWGSQYCWFVQESLIEPLLALRAEQMGTVERLQRQRAWLTELSRSQLLLNPIGARLLIRVLAELAYELGLEDAGRIRLSLDHPTHAESCLTERFESELVDERDPQVSFEVAEWLGISEGLTLEE